ncbi:MAG: MCE family protein [Chitinophagaceae bacterium]|nr:MCE family protein [Chitinophagaceae bacterium]
MSIPIAIGMGVRQSNKGTLEKGVDPKLSYIYELSAIDISMRLINVVILIIVLFGCNHKQNRLTILFDNVEGLKEGSGVYCKGFIVGEVKKLALADKGVLVDIDLGDSLRILTNSKFIISPSLLNGSHITIELSESGSILSSNDTATGYFQKSRTYDDWTSDTSKQRKMRESVEKIGEGIKGLIEASKKDTTETSK